MKKIISFSLYGDDSKYTLGMLCNVEIAKILFEDWICRIYYGNSVPKQIIEQLSEYDNVELVKMEEDGKNSYMMWRFLPVDDDDVEIMLSRDADSRLSIREKVCVDIFENSNCGFHSIQDNTNHDDVMGGMWGIKKGCLNDKMRNIIDGYEKGTNYGHDQYFMRHVKRNNVTCEILTHCSTFQRNFPEIDYQKYTHLIDINKINRTFFVGSIFFYDNCGKPYNHIHY
jgi:hypothetical protein